jgi:hypothetical protein
MRLMTPEDFEPWLGKMVRVATEPAPVEVKLVRLQRSAWHARDFREPFALFFESSLSVYLLDMAYEFDCGQGGPYSIFITQLQPLPGARLYQAVFN